MHKKLNSTDLLPITFGIILSPNPRSKNSTNSQVNLGTTGNNKNPKVCNIKKILLDSVANKRRTRKT